MKEPELLPIERVQRRHGGRRVVAPIPHELPDVRPVFLLDVGVVVLLVRAAAGELNLERLAVAVEMIVDELGAIVGVNAAQPEGQGLPDLLQGRLDAAFPAAEHGPRFDPRRVDIGHVQRMGELAVGPMAGMGHQVQLREARDRHIPVIGLQRDVVLEQGPGLRPPVAAGPEPSLDRAQATIDLARADRPQLLADGRRQP